MRSTPGLVEVILRPILDGLRQPQNAKIRAKRLRKCVILWCNTRPGAGDAIKAPRYERTEIANLAGSLSMHDRARSGSAGKALATIRGGGHPGGILEESVEAPNRGKPTTLGDFRDAQVPELEHAAGGLHPHAGDFIVRAATQLGRELALQPPSAHRHRLENVRNRTGIASVLADEADRIGQVKVIHREHVGTHPLHDLNRRDQGAALFRAPIFPPPSAGREFWRQNSPSG